MNTIKDKLGAVARGLLAGILGFTLCVPGVAFASDDTPPEGSFAGIAPARFEDAPAVGTVIDIGYGMITGLRREGGAKDGRRRPHLFLHGVRGHLRHLRERTAELSGSPSIQNCRLLPCCAFSIMCSDTDE